MTLVKNQIPPFPIFCGKRIDLSKKHVILKADHKGEIHEGYVTELQYKQFQRIHQAIEDSNQGKDKRAEVWYDAIVDINRIFETTYENDSRRSSPRREI